MILFVLVNFSFESDKCPHDCFLGQICGDWCECHWPNCDERRFASSEVQLPKIPKILKGELHVEVDGKVKIVRIQPSTFENVVAFIEDTSFNFSIQQLGVEKTADLKFLEDFDSLIK